VPLGGNRKGELRAQANVMLTMLLGGLWHGAAWNYVLWGGIHGTFLVLERRHKGALYGALPRPLQVFLTFVIWTVAIMIFHCETGADLSKMVGGIVGLDGIGTVPSLGDRTPFAYGALLVGLFVAFAVPRSELLVARFHPLVMLGSFAVFLLAVCQLLSSDFVPFIYFQF
jgi:alginate O-acetyltransferase complex protein AlgI